MEDEDGGFVSAGRAAWLPKEEDINPPPDPGLTSDLGNAVKAGAYGVVSSLGGAGEYAADAVKGWMAPQEGREKTWLDSTVEAVRGGAEATKQWGQEGATAAAGQMGKQSQREYNADFLPGGDGPSIWDKDVSILRALALKTGASIPSLAAAIIPGTMVGRAALAAGASRAVAAGAAGGAAQATNATINAGSVFEQIQSEYRKTSDIDLQNLVPAYRGLRQTGHDEQTARKVLEDYVIGSKPLVMGAISMAVGGLGVESQIARRLGGEAARGIARGAARGAAGEAVEEGVENLSQESLQQFATNLEQGKDFDWRDVLDQTVQGMAVGGIMGGAVGGVGGIGRRDTQQGNAAAEPTVDTSVTNMSQVDPDVTAAITASAPPAAPPEAAPPSPGTTPPETPEMPPAATATPVARDLEEEVDLGADDPDVSAAIAAAPAVTSVDKVVSQALDNVQVSDAAQPAVEGVQPQVVPEQAATVGVPPTTPQPEAGPAPVSLPPSRPALPSPDIEAAPTTAPLTSEAAEPAPALVPPQEPVQVPTGVTAKRVLPGKEAKLTPEQVALAKKAKDEARKVGQEMGAIKRHERVRQTVSGEAIRGKKLENFLLIAKRLQNDPDAPEPLKAAVKLDARRRELIADKQSREWRETNNALRAMQEATADHYDKLAAAKLEKVKEQYDTRDSTAEALEETGGKGRRKVEDRAARADDDAKVKSAWEAEGESTIDPNPKTRAANLADRIERVIKRAEESGVAIPTRVTPATPLYTRALSHFKRALPKLRAEKVNSNYSMDMAISEALASKGKVEDALSQFKVDEESMAREAGEADEAALVSRDDTDVVTALDEKIDRERSQEGEAEHWQEPKREAVERPKAPENKEGPAAVRGAAPKAPIVDFVKKRPIIKHTRPDPNPTKAQVAAGNQQMVKKFRFGMMLTIETAAGQVRKDKVNDPPQWQVTMKHDYGYINGSVGKDGDQIDVFLGPEQRVEEAPLVYVVNQQDPDTKAFDEHKVMLGFPDEEAAMQAYEDAYSDGRGAERIQSVDIMDMNQFRHWAKQKKQTKPAAEGEQITREGNLYSVPPTERLRSLKFKPESRRLEGEADIAAHATHTSSVDKALFSSRVRAHGHFGPNELNIAAPIAEALRKIAPDLKVYYLHKLDMMRVAGISESIADGTLAGMPAGWYDPAHDYIVIDSAYRNDPVAEHALLTHESLHAVLYDAIEYSTAAKAEVTDMLRSAKKQFALWSRGQVPEPYGFTNEHEFISEAMSSREFQDLLASLSAPAGWTREGTLGPRNPTMWDRLVTFAGRLLSGLTGRRIPYNMLEATMRVTGHLFDVSADIGRRAETPADFAKLKQFAVRDTLNGLRTNKRTAGMALATTESIRQVNEGIFTDEQGDALNDLNAAWRAIGPETAGMMQLTEKVARSYIKVRQNNKEAASQISKILNDASAANIKLVNSADPAEWDKANTHLGKDSTKGWQAKQQIPSLRAALMKLSENERKVLFDIAANFQKLSDEDIRATIASVLDNAKVTLTQAQRDDVTTRTMAGGLIDATKDADVTLLGKAVYDYLRHAISDNRQKGTYVPQMRFGDYRVLTKAKVDPKGGTWIDDNTVEFRGQSDKQERDRARKFVQGTDVPVSKTTRVYYDLATGKQISADDARGRATEVAYRVQLRRQGVHAFDNAAQAERFIRENHKDFESISEPMVRADMGLNSTLTPTQIASMTNAINANDDLSGDEKAAAVEAMKQAAIRMLPGNRLQTHSLPRKNVIGASDDLLRGMLVFGQSAAGNIARTRHSWKINNAFKRMRKIIADGQGFGRYAAQRSAVLREMELRYHKDVVERAEPGRVSRTLMTVSSIDKLFSMAYSVVNALQPWMTALPHLTGTYGAAASYQLSRAYRTIGAGSTWASGFANTGRAVKGVMEPAIDTSDVVGAVRKRVAKEPDGAKLNDMLDKLQAQGVFDNDSYFEGANAIQTGAGKAGTALSRIERVFRQLPAAVEVGNRTVVAIATYRLSTQRGNSHAAAVKEAQEVALATQLDYSRMNSPRVFNTTLGRVALQFKKYAFGMINMLADMTRRAFAGATPEERKAGVKQLIAVTAAVQLMAGLAGNPLVGLVKIPVILAGMLGVGGGWDDIDRWMTQAADRLVGKTLGDLLMKGFPAMLGANLATRLGMSDLVLFGEPRNYDAEGVGAFIAQQLVGAPGGYLMDLFAGGRDIAAGDVQKGVEKLIPFKQFSDTSKALREYNEGELGVGGAITQAIGFQPTSIARRNEKIGTGVAAQQDKKKMRRALEQSYLRADPAERKQIMKQIKAFNETSGLREKIFTKVLEKRAADRDRKRAGTYDWDEEDD